MFLMVTAYVFLGIAALPVFYYLIVLYSSWRFFRRSPVEYAPNSGFTPPVSIVKPIRGVDPEAYQNFASFCRQDYPEYEILFCVGQSDDPALPIVERLSREFPQRRIRVLFNSGSGARNDKVAKLVSLTREAKYEHLVISDSDVRVRPDYLRTVVAPLADSAVGAVTCFYVATDENTFAEKLQTIGMVSDFYAGILVARQLDGVKFTLGPTIATTRARLAEFGGYQAIQDRPADDLLVGRLIADLGYKVELLPYTVETVADYQSMGGLFHKRLRWIVVMRHMRPWGHLGLLLTQGLPWSLAAIAIHPSVGVALGYLGTYLAFRIAMTWMIDVWGLKQTSLWKKTPLIVLWDALAFFIWLASFVRKSVKWRDGEYRIQNGLLVPVTPNPADE
ncbi:MAG TPA: glycosyltransferase [Candidatus Limnocylindria bacterium]|nr:glycosyltransferase [Candidatus Limnocylindria bacterium]